MRKHLVICAVVGATLVGCTPLPNEFNRGNAASSEGSASEGSAFGVDVGSTREQARASLNEKYPAFRYIYSNCLRRDTHLAPDGSPSHRTFGPIGCTSGLGEDVYHASSGMKVANIAVIFSGGTVTKIEWWSLTTYFG